MPLLLWIVFFLISAGLGYPTLSRYDARQWNPDVAEYFKMVTGGPSATTIAGYQHRILVPLLARLVCKVVGRHLLGSWDPTSFSVLFVCSAFVACVAYLIVTLGAEILGNYTVALLGATLYLLNYSVANEMLSGLIDVGEACALMGLTYLLYRRRLYLLPLVAILGSLAKETFVPFAVVFLLTWMVAEHRPPLHTATAVAVTSCLGVGTIMLAHFLVTGTALWHSGISAGLSAGSGYLSRFLLTFSVRGVWYTFVWLVPLAIWKLRAFPRAWLCSTVTASLVALILNAYHNRSEDLVAVARPLFSIAGPLLSLSAAAFVASNAHRERLRT